MFFSFMAKEESAERDDGLEKELFPANDLTDLGRDVLWVASCPKCCSGVSRLAMAISAVCRKGRQNPATRSRIERAAEDSIHVLVVF